MGSCEVVFARERFGQVWPEMAPLVPRHWTEIAPADAPLNIDANGYTAADDENRLITFTVRRDGLLIGYALFWLGQMMMRAGTLAAWADALFIAPEHRTGQMGRDFIAWCDESLASIGIQIVHHMVHCKTDDGRGRDYAPVLERLGYVRVEAVFARKLSEVA